MYPPICLIVFMFLLFIRNSIYNKYRRSIHWTKTQVDPLIGFDSIKIRIAARLKRFPSLSFSGK